MAPKCHKVFFNLSFHFRTRFTTSSWKNAEDYEAEVKKEPLSDLEEEDLSPSRQRQRQRHDSDEDVPRQRQRQRHDSDEDVPRQRRQRHDSDEDVPRKR